MERQQKESIMLGRLLEVKVDGKSQGYGVVKSYDPVTGELRLSALKAVHYHVGALRLTQEENEQLRQEGVSFYAKKYPLGSLYTFPVEKEARFNSEDSEGIVIDQVGAKLTVAPISDMVEYVLKFTDFGTKWFYPTVSCG